MVSASRRKSKMPSSAANQSARAASMVAAEDRQLLVLTENLFDHDVERFAARALGVTDQTPQPLKILCGVAQAVDVIEPQALQFSLGDQSSDQSMDGGKRAGILDPQS